MNQLSVLLNEAHGSRDVNAGMRKRPREEKNQVGGGEIEEELMRKKNLLKKLLF